jgi:2-dehydro-3-deoxyphosphogluconate aldolase / (4S)-4-hydroxy-2-oxoglutarate aldolase
VDFLATLEAARVVAVLRSDVYGDPVPLARALLAGGVPVLEYTLTGRDALAAMARVREALAETVTVGAGTVLDAAEADAAIAAGAQFVVTPAVRPRVVERSQAHGVPCVCGGFTATEVAAALDTGTRLVKVFPARLGGPDHLRDLAGPFPSARFVPTGGITAENAAAYLRAGAVAVGIGTALLPAGAVERGDWAAISAAARRAVASALDA